MTQPVKTAAQIEAMREGGKLLAAIYDGLKKIVHAGMSELEVDAWVAKEIKRLGAVATYKTDEVNFPGVICISTNDEIVHGVPTDYIFEKGDVASFDLVITYKGMKTDAAFTMVIDDKPTGVKKHLIYATENSLYAGIDAIKGPTHTGDISAAVEKVLTDAIICSIVASSRPVSRLFCATSSLRMAALRPRSVSPAKRLPPKRAAFISLSMRCFSAMN